jgi:hypothetical protein
LRCETVHAGRHCVRINVQLGCQLAPMVERDIAQAVFAAEFHRKFELLDVDVRIGENARHVVKRRKTDAAFGADEESVILGMGVRSDDQPVICNRVQKSGDRPKALRAETWNRRPQWSSRLALSGSSPQRNGSILAFPCSLKARGMEIESGKASGALRHSSL